MVRPGYGKQMAGNYGTSRFTKIHAMSGGKDYDVRSMLLITTHLML